MKTLVGTLANFYRGPEYGWFTIPCRVWSNMHFKKDRRSSILNYVKILCTVQVEIDIQFEAPRRSCV